MAKRNVIQIVIGAKDETGGALSGAVGKVQVASAAITASLTAMAAAGVQAESGLAEIATLLDGDVGPAIREMNTQLSELSTEFGQSFGAITKARYDVVSAGFTDVAESMEVMTGSARLATVGVTSIAEAADLVTTALNGMGFEASDTERVINVLFQTVRKGKTTLPELAAGMGQVFSAARLANTSLEEVGAAMATITAAGIDTQEAATAIRSLLQALAAPSSEAARALFDLGISLEDGLGPALEQIALVGESGLDALSALIPNIRALKAAAVAGANIEKFNENLDEMTGNLDAVSDGMAIMEDTAGFQLRQLREEFLTMARDIGQELLPVVKDLVQVAKTLLSAWQGLDPATRDTIIAFELALAVIGPLIGALSSLRLVLGALAGLLGGPLGVAAALVGLAGALLLGTAQINSYRQRLRLLTDDMDPLVRRLEELNRLIEIQTTTLGGPLPETLFERQQAILALFAERKKAREAEIEQEKKDAETIKRLMETTATPPELGAATAQLFTLEDAFAKLDERMSSVDARMAALMGQPLDMWEELIDILQRMNLTHLPQVNDLLEAYKNQLADANMAQDELNRTTEVFMVISAEAWSMVQRLNAELAALGTLTADDLVDAFFAFGTAMDQIMTRSIDHVLGFADAGLKLRDVFRLITRQMLGYITSLIARIVAARLAMAALSAFFPGLGFTGAGIPLLGPILGGGGIGKAEALGGPPAVGGGAAPSTGMMMVQMETPLYRPFDMQEHLAFTDQIRESFNFAGRTSV